ncbi:uncharacterized protein C8A04DRAFT_12723 [Dichotomopilus funicola]|uniref:Uncharacterized protein n=1 Tax=Dichotomopilus funicola TaxID=1934379 RepID=A0AAN6V1E2_9PEZI|nr:hypothetical protein C8A04DRAFT_12723 [Dichotomopilus funicola]
MPQPPPAAQPAPPPGHGSDTRFFGSQIGGRSVINYGYTDMPWKLMAWDVYYFFRFFWAIPYIVWPLTPTDSGDLSELAPTWGNAWALFIHLLLGIVQVAGLVLLPALVVLPVWTAGLALGGFFLVNRVLYSLLNGEGVEYHSDPKYAPALPEHAHEQWIFINGVAAGSHWMQGNLNRLAVTFKRPILGIHNKTAGILFDVVECLIQRNWGYATKDVRVCYQIMKQTLYNPQYSKVVFILHSQGGIEGSLIIDWLLQELPQDLLAKLEVYTFGNAANHFNNPHRHIRTQHLAKHNPLAACIDSTRLAHHHRESSRVPRLRQPTRPGSSSSSSSSDDQPPLKTTTTTTNPRRTPANNKIIPSLPLDLSTSTTSPHPSSLSDRAIGHIEHYAHTTDFVALWGVLHFATSSPSSQFIPRFIGRVFARTSPRGGHQMVQHYLDGMFPLRRDRGTGGLLMVQVNKDGGEREWVPWGVEEDGNEFMESEVLVGGGGDGTGRDGDGEVESDSEDEEVEVHDSSPVMSRTGRGSIKGKSKKREQGVKVKVKVKELSRLWQYRNGKSPEETPPLLVRGPDGVVRNATM